MEEYEVILMCEKQNKRFRIEKNMLFELMESIHKNGKETIKTKDHSYIVTGIIFGEIDHKIIFT